MYKTYSSYKPSGIEWLGDIPETWEIKKIKWDTPVFRGASPRPIDDHKYFDEEGEYSWVRIADVTKSNTYLNETQEKLSDLGASLSVKLNPGSLFLSIAGSVGKPCITNIKCCIHDGFVYFPKLSVFSKFLYYVFESGEPYKGLGKLGTQLNLNTDTVASIYIGFPSKSEQQRIADFLDRKTGKIDELIAKKERMIDLLKEKRAAIINHAVTRGLNPDVPLKPSRVDLIGDIPVEWNILSIKRIVAIPITDGPHETPEFLDDGIPFISAEAVKNRKLDFSKKRGFISIEDHRRFSKKYKPSKNDIFMVKSGATTGNIAKVETDQEFNIWSPLAVIRTKPDIFTNYVFYYMQSKCFSELVALSWSYGTQQNIGMGVIENLCITIPSFNEQQQIADYLDKKTAEIDALVAKIESAIETLKEYRASLITAAVTGKIDVRGETA